MKDKHGFTLVELLVVIAIISLLIMMIFPVFPMARRRSLQSSCLSNEKQLIMAMFQYVQDYDEYFPHGWIPYTPSIFYQWGHIIYPYVHNEQIFTCPNKPSQKLVLSTMSCYGMGYGYNDLLYGVHVAKIHQPTNLIVIADCDYHSMWNGSTNPPPNRGMDDFYLPACRHFDGANSAFADGHIKLINQNEILKTKYWSLN